MLRVRIRHGVIKCESTLIPRRIVYERRGCIFASSSMMRNARTAHYPRIAAAFLVHRATASTTTIDQTSLHGEISFNSHFLVKSNLRFLIHEKG